MATRRFAGARFDHGAQFFTTRSPEFADIVDRCVGDGAVTEWTRGFDPTPDGHVRWRGVRGMTDLPKWIVEESSVEVQLQRTVTDLGELPARSYLLTPPVPQSLGVLSLSGLLPPPSLSDQLAGVLYEPTIAVLIALDEEPVGLPEHGAVQLTGHPELAFVADNRQKGVSELPALTVHLSSALSREMWAASDDEVGHRAAGLLSPYVREVVARGCQIQRWRYATPRLVWPESTAIWGEEPLVALAGEAFGGPRVEGAFLSGLAAAAAIDARLG